MKKHLKRILYLCVVLALVCTLGLTFAFFTDRVEGNGSITAATKDDLDIDIIPPTDDPDDPTDPDFPDDPDPDLTDWWATVNATARGNFNPGDKLCLDGVIKNNGTLDVEYRQTFIVHCNVAMDRDDPEFRLYNSCSAESYGALTGVDPVGITSVSDDNKTFTYVIAPAEMAASGSLQINYDLVFDKFATNAYQGAQISVDYILEACQKGGDWATIATATTNTIGAGSVNVVPDADN